jgi:hypothetical protein
MSIKIYCRAVPNIPWEEPEKGAGAVWCNGFTVQRNFRGSRYRIQVNNPEHLSKGVASIILDGRPLPENLIPPLEDTALHRVEVTLGAGSPHAREDSAKLEEQA